MMSSSLRKKRGYRGSSYRRRECSSIQSKKTFIKLVGDYGTGVFWDTFTDATDIQAKVVRAIKRVQDQPTPLTFIPLPRPVTTEWRRDWLSMASGLGLTACLEVHVLPVPTPARLSARAMNELSSGLPASLRASGGVPPEIGLELVREPSGAVVFQLPETHRRFDEVDMGELCGIRVSTSKQVSLWYTLPRGGRLALAVLDPEQSGCPHHRGIATHRPTSDPGYGPYCRRSRY